MYCPRCGHQTISDELRFCSYCGLKLGVVRASLAEAEEAPAAVLADKPTSPGLPRPRGINIGVVLMFVSAVIASFVAVLRPGLGRNEGAVILLISYLGILFLSRPLAKGILKLLSWDESDVSSTRKGMGIGATLMFTSTVVLALSSFLMYGRMRTTGFFIGLSVVFALLLLLSRYLMRALRYLFLGESTVDVAKALGAGAHSEVTTSAFDTPSLAAAPGTPVPLFGTQKVTTAEIVTPSSITEHTTSLLENK